MNSFENRSVCQGYLLTVSQTLSFKRKFEILSCMIQVHNNALLFVDYMNRTLSDKIPVEIILKRFVCSCWLLNLRQNCDLSMSKNVEQNTFILKKKFIINCTKNNHPWVWRWERIADFLIPATFANLLFQSLERSKFFTRTIPTMFLLSPRYRGIREWDDLTMASTVDLSTWNVDETRREERLGVDEKEYLNGQKEQERTGQRSNRPSYKDARTHLKTAQIFAPSE